MSRKSFRILLAMTVALLVVSTAWADQEPTQRGASVARLAAGFENAMKRQVLAAAEEAGVAVNPDSMFDLKGEGVTVMAASAAGFENTAATELAKGVDFAFAYIDAPGSGIPAGYYTLRGSSDKVALGGFDGTVELVDGNGGIAAQLPAAMEASSLTVPDPLPFPRTIVGGALEAPNTRLARIRISIWITCPNGLRICITIVIGLSTQ